MNKKIAFIGATGMLGLPVAKKLIENGYEVTALVRDKIRAHKILPPNITLVEGDIQNKYDIQKLFLQADQVYLNLNLKQDEKRNEFHAEADGLKNIIEAAKANNIKRIIIISSLVMNYQKMNNFNWWVFDLKQKAIELIKQSGIPYTIFYPSTFMENFLTTYRQGNKILLAGTSKFKMYFISADDYGQQVVNSFNLLSVKNKEYVVQGPEAFTAKEAAKVFKQFHTKEKLSISWVPLGLLKFIGIFSQKINYGAKIVEALNNYPEKFEAEQTWKELGTPITTLKDFAQL